MPSSYVAIYVHLIFGPKLNSPNVPDPIRPRLHAYLATVIQSRKVPPIIINGPADHVHILSPLPKQQAIQDFARDLKANSSRWLHEQFPEMADFHWQDGYSSFSVSPRGLDPLKRYIAGQEEHHRHKTFREELRSFLDENGVAYDERYL